MNNDVRSYLRRKLITGVSEVLPDTFISWAEGIDSTTEKITVRLSLEVHTEIVNGILIYSPDAPVEIGHDIGSELRKRMEREIRKVLRDHYGR